MFESFRGTIIRAADDKSDQLELIDDGVVTVEDGIIVFSGPVVDQISNDTRAQTQNVITLPTVNCHDHSFQPPAISGELMKWLPETLRRGEFAAAQDPENIGTRMIKAKLIEFARNGIGLTIQHTTSSIEAVEVVLKASGEVGIETRAGYVAMDQNIDTFCPGLQTNGTDAVENTRHLLEKYGRQKIVVIDRFPIAVSSDTRRQLAELARKYNVLFETHADESVNEKVVHKKLYGTSSIISTLYKDGVFMPGAMVGLAHAIHTSDEDLELVAREIRNGCKVSIRACPNSNDHLGSHWDGVEYCRFRLREWEQAGAIITLGTDQGAGSNCNLFMEMLDERRRHPAAFKPSYADLLRYGTLNGYRSLGIDFGHVNFKVGLPANFVVIRMAGAGNFYTNGDHHGNMETTASRTIHGGARTENILASYVNGKKLK